MNTIIYPEVEALRYLIAEQKAKIQQLEEENAEQAFRLQKLEALEECGVDRWSGYQDAMLLLEEWSERYDG